MRKPRAPLRDRHLASFEAALLKPFEGNVTSAEIVHCNIALGVPNTFGDGKLMHFVYDIASIVLKGGSSLSAIGLVSPNLQAVVPSCLRSTSLL